MSTLHQISNEQVLILYHASCHDGFVSAFTLWLDLQDEAEYYPIQFGQSPPDVTGKIVYIVDFSFSPEILTDMISKAKALLVIDHHKTAAEDLKNIHPKHKIFDISPSECGATLVWKYLFSEKPLPLLHKYIRSRDNWTHDVPDTDAFTLAFDLAIRGPDGQYSFELVEKYLDEKEIGGLIAVGKILLTYQNTFIEKALGHAFFCPIRIPDQNFDEGRLVVVAYINTAQLISDIGARCLEEFPFVDFCVCFYLEPLTQETQFSLRSRDDREDVSVIAKYFGGGGHRNAAAFRVKKPVCRLDYEHLNPIPLHCMYRGKQVRVDNKNIQMLTQDYLKLLQRKFPGRSLQIDLSLDTYPKFT